MSTEKYNKEQIRNRMLKYAAAFWGIKKAENLSFPPFRTPSGARTLDPNIKSVVLYQLS